MRNLITERHDHDTSGDGKGELTAILDRALEQPRLLSMDLPEGYKKAEIIGGAVVMSPPRVADNLTIFRIVAQLEARLPAELGFASDVLTPFPQEDHEFCPDLAVIPKVESDRNVSVCKPEWIEVAFEIISKATRHVDCEIKVGVYARAGIAEYVIFDPARVKQPGMRILRTASTGCARSCVTASRSGSIYRPRASSRPPICRWTPRAEPRSSAYPGSASLYGNE